MIHTTVLLKESIDGLDIHPGDIYLDGTLGSAGHAEYALQKTKGDLKVIGLDRDIDALARSRQRLSEYKNITFIESSYGDLNSVLDELGIPHVNRIMLDLGLSSDQFETSGRGFTFKNDESLLMTFKKDPGEGDLTAYQIVNTWKEGNIADVIYGYGEERYSRRIAHAIVVYREKKKIEKTTELAEIIQQAVPFFYRRGKIHPSTRTFQALRIAVNDELNTLKRGLKDGFGRLASRGRMAVISFHSLEDRIVKNFNKEKEEAGLAKIITKKPIIPTILEIKENPRARSAKLRIIEKR
ncbi:MAG: 16S rRNA (cytosine(1402)-N(4))-methyltransferase RsmH [Candidatus Taylorbacteria bacterium]|nr:16S rRNA (cytosine(1402)-N(4))-methyltransferase RsmH [Candidatus Taylorbacteria bacterium]